MKLKILTLLGTRPEIIRLSRIICELDKNFNHILEITLTRLKVYPLPINTPAANTRAPPKTTCRVAFQKDVFIYLF